MAIGGCRPIAGTGQRLVGIRSVVDPDGAGIDGVFEIDMAHCPNCGSGLKIVAAILQAPAIVNILAHLGPQLRPPPRLPTRAPAPQAA